MSSRDRRIISHKTFLILSIFTPCFACLTKGVDSGLNGIRKISKTDSKYFVTNTRIFVFFLLATVGGLGCPTPSHAASCEAIVGKWTWFIGGEVTINPDGTFTQQSGNGGTWTCTDASKGAVTLTWAKGGFVNKVILTEEQQVLSSGDPSQPFVSAKRVMATEPVQAKNKSSSSGSSSSSDYDAFTKGRDLAASGKC